MESVRRHPRERRSTSIAIRKSLLKTLGYCYRDLATNIFLLQLKLKLAPCGHFLDRAMATNEVYLGNKRLIFFTTGNLIFDKLSNIEIYCLLSGFDNYWFLTNAFTLILWKRWIFLTSVSLLIVSFSFRLNFNTRGFS